MIKKTTLIKKRDAMRRQPLPNCHDGKGALDWINVLDPSEVEGRQLRFLHDDVLAPGVSIGIHAHDDEEYYYIVAGQGTMTLDGKRCTIAAGDITAIYPGGSHGLENDGDEDLRILVIGLH